MMNSHVEQLVLTAWHWETRYGTVGEASDTCLPHAACISKVCVCVALELSERRRNRSGAVISLVWVVSLFLIYASNSGELQVVFSKQQKH
eukprot:m.332755 g.332755  ORF g.332755 m.332755 type:complete len:90 (+) comp16061_c1_seq8:6622-6891(+)